MENEVNCECGQEWGVHSSWCPMVAYVIRDTALPEYTVHHEVTRLHDEEGMDWTDALIACNID
jgi:hypothetical protein